jgi:hypothetical protein
MLRAAPVVILLVDDDGSKSSVSGRATIFNAD